MGCMQGDEMKLQFAGPKEQEEMYRSVARMIGGYMKRPYQTPPMYSQGPNPGQTGAMDYVMRQLGYGGYQHPGMYTAPSQQKQMLTWDRQRDPTGTVTPGGAGQGGSPTGINPRMLRQPSGYYF